MARTIYGATIATSPTNGTNDDGGRVIGTNSEVFTGGDIVTITSGYLDVFPNDNFHVYGVVLKTATMASDNQTVAKVKPNVIVPDLSYEFLMGTNSDLAVTSVGTYYTITGATGAQQVDVSTGAVVNASRVVECTKVDPLNEGGTGAGSGLRQGYFRFVKPFNIQQDAVS